MEFQGKICIMGGGSWATALAKIILMNGTEKINWYMRRPSQIEDFKRLGHNLLYLSAVNFDTSRIHFYRQHQPGSETVGRIGLCYPITLSEAAPQKAQSRHQRKKSSFRP